MKKKLLAFVLATVMTVGCLTACGNSDAGTTTDPSAGTEEAAEPAESAEPSEDAAEPAESSEGGSKILRVSIQNSDVALDTHLNTYSYIMKVTDNVCESLLYTNEEGVVEPTLLESMPELSDDMLTYTFKLKEGVKFHNGVELTTKDVKYSLERVVKSKSMASLLQQVEGYEALLNGEADELSGIEVIDDYNFKIHMSSVYTPFTSALSTPYCCIYPAEACEEAGENWAFPGDNCVLYGTGPFKLDSYDETGVVLSRFDDYHRGPAKLDGITYTFNDDTTALNLFKAGSIDVCWFDGANYRATEADPLTKDKIHSFQPSGGYYISFNVKEVPEAKVREALSWAIDRENLCTGVLAGTAEPSSNMLGEGLIGHNPDAAVFKYDPEKAKQLLAEAGYPDGYDLTVNVNTRYETSLTLAQAIQSMAEKGGFRITIDQVDAAEWSDQKKNGGMTCAIGNWYVDYNDPDSMLYPVSPGRVDSNSIFWHNDEYEKLMEEGVQTDDAAERQTIYERADEILCHEDCVAVPLYYETKFYLLQDNITGFSVAPTFRTMFYETDIQ